MRPNPWFVVPVVAAGVAGALIGRNVPRVSCAPVEPDVACQVSGAAEVGFAIVGALAAMVGVAVVIVLVIRSLEEWRTTRDDSEDS